MHFALYFLCETPRRRKATFIQLNASKLIRQSFPIVQSLPILSPISFHVSPSLDLLRIRNLFNPGKNRGVRRQTEIVCQNAFVAHFESRSVFSKH